MKKYICAFLLFVIFCLAGCSLPVNQNSDNNKNVVKKKQAVTQPEKVASEALKPKEAEAGTGLNTKENGEQTAKDNIPITDDKSGGAEKTIDNSKARLTLYYQNEDGILIPVTRIVKKQEGIARVALTALIDNSIIREELEYYGVYPVLPLGTEVTGISIRNGTATVEFNDKLLSYKDETAERNIISSIVYTLTEFKSIGNVKLIIGGLKSNKLKFGTDISKPLERKNTLINTSKVNLQSGLDKLDVYLLASVKKDIFVLPVSVEYENANEKDLPEKVIEFSEKQYLKGKVYSEFPTGTRLRKSTLSGGTLVLDFNGNFLKYGGTSKEDAILKQIQYSMKQINGVDRIRITVDGKEAVLPEGTEISGGLPIPSDINVIKED